MLRIIRLSAFLDQKYTSLEREEKGDNRIKLNKQQQIHQQLKLQNEKVADYNLKKILPGTKCSR